MKLKVLIVDSDSASGDAIHAAMAGSNIDAIVEADSSRAAGIVSQEKFDALFLELRLPPPDGAQLARAARNSGINRRTPIIMVSGQDAHDAMSRSFEAGANFFLFKPFDRARLMRVLRAAHAPIEQERRRFHRVQVARRVTVECGADKLEGKTVDLSLQGMLVETPRTFPAASQVKLKLEVVPGQKPVSASGKVVRVVGITKMGIELDPMPNEDAERLQSFLLPLILKSVGE